MIKEAPYRKPLSKTRFALSPRRKIHAQRLLDFVNWHGRKVILNAGAYSNIQAAHQLDRFEVNQAADDLYAMGLCGAAMVGDAMVLYGLAVSIEEAA